MDIPQSVCQRILDPMPCVAAIPPGISPDGLKSEKPARYAPGADPADAIPPGILPHGEGPQFTRALVVAATAESLRHDSAADSARLVLDEASQNLVVDFWSASGVLEDWPETCCAVMAAAQVTGRLARLVAATETGDPDLPVPRPAIERALRLGVALGLPQPPNLQVDPVAVVDNLRSSLHRAPAQPTPARPWGERPRKARDRAAMLSAAVEEGAARDLLPAARDLVNRYCESTPTLLEGVSIPSPTSPISVLEGWEVLGVRWVLGAHVAGAVANLYQVAQGIQGPIAGEAVRFGLDVASALGVPALRPPRMASAGGPLDTMRSLLGQALHTANQDGFTRQER